MSFLDDALGAVGTALLGPAGGVVGPLMGDLLGGAGGAGGGGAAGLGGLGSLFGAATQGLGGLEGMFGQAFGGLLGGLNPTQGQQFNCPLMPFPFSPGASGIPSSMFNNPSSLVGNLGSATNSLGGGLNGVDIAGIGAGLDSQMTDAVNQAQSGKMQDVLAAQQKMMQIQVTFQTLSNFIQTIGKLESEAVTNSKIQ